MSDVQDVVRPKAEELGVPRTDGHFGAQDEVAVVPPEDDAASRRGRDGSARPTRQEQQ